MNKCPICEQEFGSEAELQEHTRTAHPEDAGAEQGMDEAREQTDEMTEEGEAERTQSTPTV
jgi:hypothetical protein